MSTVVIDYGSGNLRSVGKALMRAAEMTGLSQRIVVSSKAEDVVAAERIVLPGVGAFGDCMSGLAALDGMLEALDEAVVEKGRAFLGICVGMQLMAERGIEHGVHKGLCWIEGEVVRIEPAPEADGGRQLKVPHMGWNEVRLERPEHPIFAGIEDLTHFYFLHSYHMQIERPEELLASVEYGGPLAAAVGRDNLVGVQFHPEKSQESGLRLLANFLRWSL